MAKDGTMKEISEKFGEETLLPLKIIGFRPETIYKLQFG